MFSGKTLFVVGAGASYEAGLPIGATLANIISKKLSIVPDGSGRSRLQDADLWFHLQNQFRDDVPAFLDACAKISYGLPLAKSIDGFLDSHSDNRIMVDIGKAAIVRSILSAEKESRLFFNKPGYKMVDLSILADTWYVEFMKMFSSTLGKADLYQAVNDICFIIFNYDRCVETFLLEAFKNRIRSRQQRSTRYCQ